MRKRIVQKTYNNGNILYEVEKKWPILGWKLVWIEGGLYDMPAYFKTLEEAVNFIKPKPEKSEVIKKVVVFEQ